MHRVHVHGRCDSEEENKKKESEDKQLEYMTIAVAPAEGCKLDDQRMNFLSEGTDLGQHFSVSAIEELWKLLAEKMEK